MKLELREGGLEFLKPLPSARPPGFLPFNPPFMLELEVFGLDVRRPSCLLLVLATLGLESRLLDVRLTTVTLEEVLSANIGLGSLRLKLF